ncbi:MAG: hypothetical protein H6677_17840 [Candidatus Obscuribacterales bacterium]|nr:hypothetical protein [Candidatus Obscuribacterales bacterium]
MADWSNVEKEIACEFALFSDERINVDYRLWLKQKNEIVALRYLVAMQMLGIFVLAVAVAYLMIGWY